jgi:hypothetical protein
MEMSRAPKRHRSWWAAFRLRRDGSGVDLGQAALVTVVAFSVVASLVGVVLVRTVVQSNPIYQTKAVAIYANRALEAGQNAYLTAINANPSLAQCNTSTNSSGTCGGIDYGQWNLVNGSNANGADPEYYAFGNPQPTFSATTNALTSLSVQVVGAAYDPSTSDNYLFDQATISVTPANGFLSNVWWSNYESYSSSGNYSTCNYNWKLSYNINNSGASCSPVYFGPGDYLFGPVYTNDSVFVSGNGAAATSPDFGTSSSASSVTTADPHCLFVDSTYGMGGSDANCARASSDVSLYDNVNSSYGHSVEQPPVDDSQLGTIAGQNGCLYSGPTQITLSTNASGVGQMTVVSPDTSEGTQTVNGTDYTWDTNNITSNVNNCPNNGTAPIPSNGVVFVENASASQTQAWANPFDDPVDNSVTNVTVSPTSPSNGQSVTLTATVTSATNQLDSGATVAFSQTTRSNGQTRTNVINGCSAQSLSSTSAVTPATSPATYTATATCQLTYGSTNTGAFSASYSGGPYATTSSGNSGQTYVLNSVTSYGPDAQVTAGGCSSCYYGQAPNGISTNAEGDAFVNGSLSGQLTIGTANNVIIDGNITYADCAGQWVTGQSGSSAAQLGFCLYNVSGTNDTLGLIANNYVEINRPILASTSNSNNPTVLASCGATPAATCDPSDGTDGITVDAALLALTQSFVVNNYADGGTEGQLTVYGSIQQFARGPVGTFNVNGQGVPSAASGYLKQYTWDPLLNFVSPPSYLVPTTPSWVLASVTTNAGVGSTGVCPPLQGIYDGTVQGGAPVTQYCSGAGGLPNYPSVTAPTPVTGVSASASTTGTVTVNWTDPVSNNGSSIGNYGLSISPTCPTCTISSLNGAGVTSATITGLTPGSTYSFTVTATNGSGTSSPSAPSGAVTIPNVPSAPTNASATTNADGSITLAWVDPANNGSPITGYSVTPSPSCPGCSYSSLSGASVSSTTVTGLTQGTSYSFTVTATNGMGTGAPSAASNTVTAPSVPGTPTGVSATAGNGQATVTWTAPGSGGSAITGYVVTPYLNGTTVQTAQTFVSTATSESVTGLTNGNAYTFKVAATNGVGTGNQSTASASITLPTAPGAPTIGTATAGVRSAQVTWTAPSSNGGSAITGYVVTPYLSGAAQAAQTFNSTATTETVTGLTAGSAYTFKVAAINAVGTGNQSAASGSVTIPTVPGTPNAPTVAKNGSSTTSLVVTWVAPSTGGSPITSYTVNEYTKSGSTYTLVATFNPSGTGVTYTPTGLSSSKTYYYTVTATNAVGSGSASGYSAGLAP